MNRLLDQAPLLRCVLMFLLVAVPLAAMLPSGGGASEVSSEGAAQQAEEFAASESHLAIQRARKLLDQYGYVAVFGVIFLEGVGIPAPGETLVIAAAVEAARGSLNIVALLAITLAAAVFGNSAGYAIGRFGGSRLLGRLPISEDRLSHVSKLFDRYGGWFILVARFIDGPRQLNGIIAGTLKMPWWEFTFWNVLGALLWVGVWCGTAYWFGHDIKSILKTLQPLESILIGVLLAAIVGAALYVLWRRRAAQKTSPDS